MPLVFRHEDRPKMIKIVQTSAIANNECPLGKLAELRSAKAPRFGRARPTTCLKKRSLKSRQLIGY